MLGVLAAISIRLWFIQIRMNAYYCSRIQGRSEVTVRIPAIRGVIRDRTSVPSYDPNSFIPAISARDWVALRDAEADPLTNRAISAYAPGSAEYF